jgi:tetratricopeptide (TPR) repeat protein
LAAGAPAAARAQLQAVLSRAPAHPVATALLAGLEASAVAVDGGVAAAEPAAAPPVPPPSGRPVPAEATPEASAPTERPPGGGGAGAGGRSYEDLVALAQSTLDDSGPRRARPLFEQALALRPSGPEALGGLGACLLGEHRTAEAISRLRAAAAAGYTEALIGLGQAYRDSGETARALEAYEEYLERSPRGRHRSVAEYQAAALRRAGGAAAAPAPAPETPPTPADSLPAPEGTTEPPASDTPAVEASP